MWLFEKKILQILLPQAIYHPRKYFNHISWGIPAI